MDNNLLVHKVNLKLWVLIILMFAGLSIISLIYFDQALYRLASHHIQPAESIAAAKGKHQIYYVATDERTLFFVTITAFLSFILSKWYIPKKHLFIFTLYLISWLLITAKIKTLLKYFFSRCVPIVCPLNNIQSLIDNYGFGWFINISGFASFPSGHCTIVTFFLIWSYHLYPQIFRWLLVIYILLLFGLVSFSFHFLSDCFAGTVLGLSCGLISMLLWTKVDQNASR
jgi:membrane-associated phospholipid phosphatase